jgi:Putative beta-barrel porin 2
LSVLTEQRETAQIGVKLGSDWKIEASGYTSKDDEPIALAPNLQLTQNSGTASLEYFGFGGLTSGLTATYLSGDYRNTNGTGNPSFDQTTAGLLAKYKLSRTTFDGQLGYSRRNSATGTDNTSGLTGLFDWKQQLTPKTSFTAKIDRMINSYFLNSGSEIDTEAGASIDWQATYKLGVAVGYTFTYRFFPGQGNNPVGSDRTDIQELATMTINYQPQRWLQIKPYANVTTRRSTFIGGHFSQNIFGVSVIVTPYGSRPHGR